MAKHSWNFIRKYRRGGAASYLPAKTPTSYPAVVTTTTTIAAATTVDMTGSVSVSIPDTTTVSTAQLTTAMKKSLATEFSVPENNVQVSIQSGGGRRLATTHTFDFTITVPAASQTAAQTKADNLGTNPTTLTTELKNNIVAVTSGTAAPVTLTQLSGTSASGFAATTVTTSARPVTSSAGRTETATTAMVVASLVSIALRQ
jgi:hypothetical protein